MMTTGKYVKNEAGDGWKPALPAGRAFGEGLPSAGRYHTFVFFAADIPAVVEPFGVGAIA